MAPGGSRAIGVCVALLAAGAAPAFAGSRTQLPAASAESAAAAQLGKGDVAKARDTAAGVLQSDPRQPRLQFLNGLSYHLAAERGDAASLDLARVGYETSLRFDPNDFWAQYMLGVLAFERGDWEEAQGRFSSAVLSRPDDWRALAGLAAASYYAGDTGLAGLAGARSARLAPKEPQAQRAAALGAAAAGDDAGARLYLAAYGAAGGAGDLASRIQSLQRTAAVDSAYSGYGAAPASDGPPPQVSAPSKQMLIEVTLILSDDTHRAGRGLNLLDGLKIQYGIQHNQVDQTGTTENFSRTITQKIAVPDVDYSLNLFNHRQQYYWVLARPTLTAYLNEESAFFVGHTVNVQVSGVNLGSLQAVDAGVSLKLTPLSIDGQHVKFRVSADRSFFDPVPLQGFDKGISVFKEQASATAELDFGQTLILSGLSENVYDADHSVVPGANKLPLVGTFLGRHDVEQQQTSVLILVTPLQPVAASLPRRVDRQGMAAKVADLWTSVVDPRSDIAVITDHLLRWRSFSRAERGDLAVAGPSDPRVMREALAQMAAR